MEDKLEEEVARLLEEEERIATESMPRAHKDLISYYKRRIEQLEAERQEANERFSLPTTNQERIQKLKEELLNRNDEVRDLQRAISDAQHYLYDERDMVLKLSRENDRLRIQEDEDRKRIQHLLALTKPVQQEVTFFRDRVPKRMARLFQGRPPEKKETISSRGSRPPPGFGPMPRDPPVLRTVVFPNDKTRSLEATIESLEAELREREKFESERRAAEAEQRELEREQCDMEIRRKEEEVLKADAKTKEMERLYRSTIKDLLKLRHEVGTERRVLREEKATMRQAMKRVTKQSKKIQERHEQTKRRHREHIEEEKKKGQEKVFEDLTAAHDEILILRDQYEAAQKLWRARVEHLEGLLKKEKSKRLYAERKARLDREGYGSECRLLRQETRGLERQVTDARMAITHLAHGGLSRQEAALISAQFNRLKAAEGRIQNIRDKMDEIKMKLASEQAEIKYQRKVAGSN
eukprot:jgi/Bigna1/90505/estExt_fgenesh1_pg.C_720035